MYYLSVTQRLTAGYYDRTVDVASLGASYAFGLITNYPYRDGNKRIGFLAMVTFLEMRGLAFTATDAEVVAKILRSPPDVASKKT